MLPKDVDAEAQRLQRCSEFSAEWQATAAGFWANLQFFLGAAAAGLAAVSSGSAFSDQDMLAGVLAAAAALAAAVLASLSPGERSEQHKKAADEFHALATDLRLFRDLGLPQADGSQPLDSLAGFEARGVGLTRSSPWAPRRLEHRTKQLVAKGQRFYDNEGGSVVSGASTPP